MYKDKAKQREATREAVRRHREKQGITSGITSGEAKVEGITYPDILDKLTDPVWRKRLEKICQAFANSHHKSYVNDVWLGDYNLSTVCDLLDCTT